MKKSIINTLWALGLLLITSHASYATLTGDSGLDSTTMMYDQVGVGSIIKIRASEITMDMPGVGFETSFGQQYSITDVKHVNLNSRSALQSILQRSVIELRTGEILYREEIEFGLIKLQQVSRGFDIDPLGKAPHTPD